MIRRQFLSTLIFEDKDGKQAYNDRARASPEKRRNERKLTLWTVTVRFDCPTVTIPEYKKVLYTYQ